MKARHKAPIGASKMYLCFTMGAALAYFVACLGQVHHLFI